MGTLFEHLDPNMLEMSTICGVWVNLQIPTLSWISVICDRKILDHFKGQ